MTYYTKVCEQIYNGILYRESGMWFWSSNRPDKTAVSVKTEGSVKEMPNYNNAVRYVCI